MEGSREQAERLKAEFNGELRRVEITWDELLMAATGGPGDLPGKEGTMLGIGLNVDDALAALRDLPAGVGAARLLSRLKPDQYTSIRGGREQH